MSDEKHDSKETLNLKLATMGSLLKLRTGKQTKAALEKQAQRRRKRTRVDPSPDDSVKQSPESLSDDFAVTSSSVSTSQPPPSSTPNRKMAPKVRVVDGQIVIDSSSLYMDDPSLSQEAFESMTTVDETGGTRRQLPSKRTPSSKWNTDETNRFYQALRKYGTDFSILMRLFPTRTRQQLRNKFKREEREHPWKIEDALKHRTRGTEHYTSMANDVRSENAQIAEEKRRREEEEQGKREAEEAQAALAATAVAESLTATPLPENPLSPVPTDETPDPVDEADPVDVKSELAALDAQLGTGQAGVDNPAPENVKPKPEGGGDEEEVVVEYDDGFDEARLPSAFDESKTDLDMAEDALREYILG
eukprot:gnl/Trimastix_PCT/2643.p1 GENE.gnl/Trimastix_PCT/2643~~gnl/Trimastix_PCT/2643.p1  ORF type:complete len:362 (-),score=73.94 gnl/Trimastix_PCT/2643:3-1088(-)